MLAGLKKINFSWMTRGRTGERQREIEYNAAHPPPAMALIKDFYKIRVVCDGLSVVFIQEIVVLPVRSLSLCEPYTSHRRRDKRFDEGEMIHV